MSHKTKKAAHAFCNGHSCAQAVLTTYSEHYNLDVEQAMKLTTGLAGGMGRMAETCGTVTGSILVLGLEKSTGKVGDTKSKEATMKAVQDFSAKFKERHGTLLCKELLECDISQEEGYKKARETGVFRTRCPHFVETAVELLDEVIEVKVPPV